MIIKKYISLILTLTGIMPVIFGNSEEVNLIESVTVHKNEIRIAVNEQFKKKYLLGDFFAQYDEDINLEKLDYSIQIMPFILNVVSIVWISGKTYYIDSIDAELATSLKKNQKNLQAHVPKNSLEGKTSCAKTGLTRICHQ